MSKEEEAEAGEVVEKLRDPWFPLDLDRNYYFHLPSSPQSPGLCLSPLWNFWEENNQEFTGDIHVMTSTANGLPRFEFSRSPDLHAGDPFLSESSAGNHDKWDPSPPLQCLKYRIAQALAHIQKSTEQQVLAQVWAPVKMGTRYVLTTSEQPFILSVQRTALSQYRMVSLMYIFPADAVDDDLGLPGRVFKCKLPEWAPDVRFYSNKEYPQLNHAMHYNVRGTLALPLFESGGCCIGVLELIMTSPKINYAPEIDLVCTALEAVKLKSSKTFNPCTHVVDLAEILELLTVVCETYKLPLAQTWCPTSNRQVVPCDGSLHVGISSERRSMKEVCLSSINLAFYVAESHMWGFREASTEHNLIEGQGVVGRAYKSRKSCFCEDVSLFHKIDYPLVLYARMFGLHSCFAVPISDIQTGKEIYILEFFLPPTLGDFRCLQKLVNFLSTTISQSSPNLQMMSHKEFGKERANELIHSHVDVKPALSPECFQRQNTVKPPKYGLKNSSIFDIIRCKYVAEMNPYELPGKQEVDFIYNKKKIDEGERSLPFTSSGKEDKWSLAVLEQLYGKSLQDAADCIGVSRSTMKRICRKHGVSRWPSPRRKKTRKFSHEQTHKNKLLQGAEGIISHGSPNLYPGTSSVVSTPFSSIKENFLQCELQSSLKQTQVNLLSPPTVQYSLHSSHACPETHLGELLAGNTSSTVTNLLPQCAKKQMFECSDELPSILQQHVEKIASNVDAPAPELSDGAATQGKRTASIKIKARYGEDIIRFELHYPLALPDLEKEVQKRLNLKLGIFSLKYLDADNDWILIACDEDLQGLLDVSLSKGIIRMLVGEMNHL